MDAMSNPKVERVVIVGPSQSGKTDMTNNYIGYRIDIDPCPMMVVRYSIEMANEYSKLRFSPMVRDTPCLREKVSDPKSRNSESTILLKSFFGGSLAITGANSPASLASRINQVLILDDLDRFEPTSEGDSADLAIRRLQTYTGRRKIIMNSSPKNLGVEETDADGNTQIIGGSRIWAAYEESDMCRRHVPCVNCGTMDVLTWPQVVWPNRKPREAMYQCLHCGKKMGDADISNADKHGQWIADKESTGIAGFWFNAIYSPWVTLGEMAVEFNATRKKPERLQVFINTMLAERWDTQKLSEGVQWQKLFNRREHYPAQVPAGGLVLTGGFDIQGNRIEGEIVAHGIDDESWTIEEIVFHGDPLQPSVWQSLDDYLKRTFEHESGVDMRITTVGIDSGYLPDEVYKFTKPRQGQRIYATRGASVAGKPLVGRVGTNNSAKAKVFPVGTDTGKVIVFGRLNIKEPGAGYMHFPTTLDEEYFKQMCSERLDPKGRWVKTRTRNEKLDCRVINNVVLAVLKPNYEAIRGRIDDESKVKGKKKEKPKENFSNKKRGGWVNGWK